MPHRKRHTPTSEDYLRAHTIGELRPLSAPILVVPYDPAWPDRFQHECQKIRRALGEQALRIDHVGSTSIAICRKKKLLAGTAYSSLPETPDSQPSEPRSRPDNDRGLPSDWGKANDKHPPDFDDSCTDLRLLRSNRYCLWPGQPSRPRSVLMGVGHPHWWTWNHPALRLQPECAETQWRAERFPMFVLKRILLPVDFSEICRAACYAQALGLRFHSEIVLLHAEPNLSLLGGMGIGAAPVISAEHEQFKARFFGVQTAAAEHGRSCKIPELPCNIPNRNGATRLTSSTRRVIADGNLLGEMYGVAECVHFLDSGCLRATDNP
jgi:hypothetical protein